MVLECWNGRNNKVAKQRIYQLVWQESLVKVLRMLRRKEPDMFTSAPKEFLPWWVVSVMVFGGGRKMFRQLRIVGLNLMPFNSGSKQEESVQLCRSKATLCFGCSFCKKKKYFKKLLSFSIFATYWSGWSSLCISNRSLFPQRVEMVPAHPSNKGAGWKQGFWGAPVPFSASP